MPAKKQVVAKKAVAKKVPAKKMAFKTGADLDEFLDATALKEGHRMVVKGAVVNDATYDTAEEAPEPPPAPIDAKGTWAPTPSRVGQMRDLPATVRTKAPVTYQFVLSDPKQLKAWNALQARMHPPESPAVHLSAYETTFSQSLNSYIVLVNCAEYEYQQLI